jgi:hypothetical protein
MKKTLLPLIILCLAGLACVFSTKNTPLSNTPAQLAQAGTPAAIDLSGYWLPNPAVGLDGLDSYHQELRIAFQGSNSGQAASFEDVYISDFQRQPLARFITMKTTDEQGHPSIITAGSIAEAHYYQPDQDKPCMVKWGTQAPGGAEAINPATFLPPVQSATDAGKETINGVAARHYQLKAEADMAQGRGDFWLAEKGGYVVKYTLTIQGSQGSSESKGDQTFTYELSKVNNEQAIALPEGCPAVLSNIPAMADATNLMRMPSALDYTSPSSVDTIGTFYQDQMKQLGWVLVSNHNSDPQKPILVFNDAEKSQVAVVSLEARTNGVWVNVQVRKHTISGQDMMPNIPGIEIPTEEPTESSG